MALVIETSEQTSKYWLNIIAIQSLNDFSYSKYICLIP